MGVYFHRNFRIKFPVVHEGSLKVNKFLYCDAAGKGMTNTVFKRHLLQKKEGH